MAKKQQSTTKYSYDHGNSIFTIYYKGNSFVGTAICHDDDKDMESKIIGLTIAEARATLAYLRHIRDNELRPQLASLKQLMYSMNHSKQYNRKSYEARMLYRHIQMYEEDLKNIKQEISRIKFHLFHYIKEKDELHQILREKRKAKSDQEIINEN